MPVPDNDCTKRTHSPSMRSSKTLSYRSAESAYSAISGFGKIHDAIDMGRLLVLCGLVVRDVVIGFTFINSIILGCQTAVVSVNVHWLQLFPEKLTNCGSAVRYCDVLGEKVVSRSDR
jgi:hypothetical protein